MYTLDHYCKNTSFGPSNAKNRRKKTTEKKIKMNTKEAPSCQKIHTLPNMLLQQSSDRSAHRSP